MITLDTQGPRIYFRGDTYQARADIKALGGHWDGDSRAWWIGAAKAEDAEALVARLGAGNGNERKPYGPHEPLAGKGLYKGKTYYLAGRVERGRTRWDDRVSPVLSRTGKYLLVARDGAFSFWALEASVAVSKTYRSAQTLDGIRRFLEERRQMTPEQRSDADEDAEARRRGEACPCSGGACRCGSDAPCCMCD